MAEAVFVWVGECTETPVGYRPITPRNGGLDGSRSGTQRGTDLVSGGQGLCVTWGCMLPARSLPFPRQSKTRQAESDERNRTRLRDRCALDLAHCNVVQGGVPRPDRAALIGNPENGKVVVEADERGAVDKRVRRFQDGIKLEQWVQRKTPEHVAADGNAPSGVAEFQGRFRKVGRDGSARGEGKGKLDARPDNSARGPQPRSCGGGFQCAKDSGAHQGGLSTAKAQSAQHG